MINIIFIIVAVVEVAVVKFAVFMVIVEKFIFLV